MPSFNITVKGYKALCCEAQMSIEADTEAEATIKALEYAQEYGFEEDEYSFNDASSAIVWEEAELAEDDE